MGAPYLVFPGTQVPSTQNSVDSEKALRVSGLKNEGGWGATKVVIIKVLRHRALRRDRDTGTMKAKCPRLGGLPGSAPPAGSSLGADPSADPIARDRAAAGHDENVKHEETCCKSLIGSPLASQPRLIPA